jgi:hypothetical protein
MREMSRVLKGTVSVAPMTDWTDEFGIIEALSR